ncbi:hypothetical protein [Flavobacterium sp.]|uniref:hypothetical protein n=1 Tax=Flavobacterium sp. TaxID=239 RepID=UPI003D1124C6
MKKFVFSLIALGMFTVTSACNGKVEKPVKEAKQPVKKEVSKETKKEDVKTVTCAVWSGSTWIQHSYSCFFCWGGAMNGCIAEASLENGLAQ